MNSDSDCFGLDLELGGDVKWGVSSAYFFGRVGIQPDLRAWKHTMKGPFWDMEEAVRSRQSRGSGCPRRGVAQQ